MTPDPTPRTIPSAPAAGQLELEDTMTDTTTDAARLHAAAERALDSLEDLCATTTDPGVEALGARFELATALGRVGKNEMPLDELGFSRDPQVIRQAALHEAAKRLEDDDHLAAAAELREMAGELTPTAPKQPPMDPVHVLGIYADDTTPAALVVGDRYDCRHGGESVTVTRLWKLENGHDAVDFEWVDGGESSALPLASFHRAYQPAEAAQSADRVVAYRNPDRPHTLLCREHAESYQSRLVPVTSEDLPDGGICTWHDCGRDVLADS